MVGCVTLSMLSNFPMERVPLTEAELADLMDLLERRLEIIGDSKLRDSDPDGHLEQLRHASEALMAFHERHRDNLPPRLDHFLENASYGKALDWARSERER